MNSRKLFLASALGTIFALTASANVLYVDLNSTNPVAPYTSWATAATVIQDAVDAASAGDTVLVTDGVYQTGGQGALTWTTAMTNRVAVTKALTVQSVNGPACTRIQGYQVPGLINGNDAVRCVYLTNGAALIGFTLQNGATGTNGGNSYLVSGGGVYCQSTNALVSNCVLVANCAFATGGGAYSGTLNRCLILSNSCSSSSGGGGGIDASTLNNCLVSGNHAYSGGGGFGIMNNCTICFNSAQWSGGGSGTLTNCILYYNTAPNYPDFQDTYTAAYSCCLPHLPTSGAGNITNAPMFIDYVGGDFHLLPISACLNAGLPTPAAGTLDLDGNPRSVAGWPDLGAYECQAPCLVRYADASNPTPTPPYTNWATAAQTIQDAVDTTPPGGTVWVNDGLYQTGARVDNSSQSFPNRLVVAKPLTVQSVHGPDVTIIQGGPVPGNGTGNGSCRCAYLTNGAVLSGFTLTNGDVGTRQGGGVVCDSYKEVLTNCVLVRCAANQGGAAYGGTLNRCLLAGNTAAYFGGATVACNLNGSTLLTNSAFRFGGACYGGTLNNCLLLTNSVSDRSVGEGGGAYICTLSNCVLAGNWSGHAGGGAYLGSGTYIGPLYNCTVVGNSAGSYGGGIDGPGSYTIGGNGGSMPGVTLNNCIVYYNSAPTAPNYYSSPLNFCCTTPLPAGLGNFTNPPLFVNALGADLHLQATSPCINAGNNACAGTSTDLDGAPRIAGGTVDVGAYEFQSPASRISYAWLQQYGLPCTSAAESADPDGDGLDNWHEWLCGTSPTDAASVLKLFAPTGGVSGLTVSWQSVTNRMYFLQRSTNLAASPAFITIKSSIVGQDKTTSVPDTTATTSGPYFYRVGVQ